MIDKQTNILNKIEYLKDTLLHYAADHYDHNTWPIELQYDFDDIETIETSITEYDIPITDNEMLRCNKIYKKYLL